MDYMLLADSLVLISKKLKLKIYIEQVASIAGFDPVQLVLFSSLFFLLKEPEVFNTLVQDIRSGFNSYNETTPDALVTLPISMPAYTKPCTCM